MGDLADDTIRMWERLEGDRGTWKAHWQDVANYTQPMRNDYLGDKAPGQKRMTYVYDSTPIRANEQFASGMHSLLTSPTLPWFALQSSDEGLNQNDNVRLWLDETARRMYDVFNSPERNFASQSQELYLDLGAIGTGVMVVLESWKSGVLFSTKHLRECCVAENEEDRVDTVVRRWKWTAKQAIDTWGDACGDQIKKAYTEAPNRQFEFLHMVRPRRERDLGRRDAKHKPFESVYVCLTDRAELAVSGFDEFPYLVPRLSKIAGEIYGRGLGMIALPDIKMLNEMVRTVLKSAQKIVDPPLMMPDDGFLMPIKTVPGGINYYRAGTRDRIEPIKTDGQVNLGIELLNSLRNQILETFNVDWLRLPTDPNNPASAGKGITATYVLQERDEKMRLLSPMLARLQSEFLGPLIDRTFKIMWRQSVMFRFGPGAMLTPPPPELSGKKLRTEYISPLAIAQRTSQLDGIARLVQMATSLAAVDQTAPQVLDCEAILRQAAVDLNTPAATMKSPERLQAERQAQQALAASQAQQEQIATLAGAAKDGGQAAQSITSAIHAQPGQVAA